MKVPLKLDCGRSLGYLPRLTTADPAREFANAEELHGRVLQLGKKGFRRLMTG